MGNVFLVTGATGFIGSNIVRELVRQKKQVSIIVRDKKLNWRLRDIAHDVDIHECDIQDVKLDGIVSKVKPDYVFHLASYGNLPNEDEIDKMIDINLKGTINLINAVRKTPFKLFINSSSCAEYGIKKKNMVETDTLEPINNTGVIKSVITLYCQKEAMRNNLPIINFRLFTPYGYFEGMNRLIPSVTLNALEGISVNVSSPVYVRDFIFIEDVINAYISATNIKHNLGEIYNIGSGKQHAVEDIVRLILEITQSKSNVQWGAVKKQARYIEPETWQADISKTKKILRWEPKNSIESGLGKTVQWFKKNKNLYSQN